MSHKKISVRQFADELESRLNKNQSVDCCKEELLNLASMAREKMGSELIEVSWVD